MPWGASVRSRKKIIDKKADFVLALKGNQGSLREDVEVLVAEQKAKGFADTEISRDRTIDGDHDRIETRTTTVIHDVERLQVAGGIGKRDILRALPDPGSGRRLQGFADGAITGWDEKQRHAIRRALSVDGIMQAHLAAVMDQALELEKAVELLFIEVLHAHDRTGARHTQHQQAAGCIGEGRDTLLDLVADVLQFRVMGGAVRLGPAGLFTVKMLIFEAGVRSDRDEIPMGVRVAIDLFGLGRGHVRMSLSAPGSSDWSASAVIAACTATSIAAISASVSSANVVRLPLATRPPFWSQHRTKSEARRSGMSTISRTPMSALSKVATKPSSSLRSWRTVSATRS